MAGFGVDRTAPPCATGTALDGRRWDATSAAERPDRPPGRGRGRALRPGAQAGGIQPTVASEWGYDLSRALDDAASGIWWTTLFPGLAIVLLVTGLTLVGEGLNETINPTLRKRRIRKVFMPPNEPTTALVQGGA
jgi:hypothetical protein